MVDFDELIEQLKNGEFRPASFSIFNFIENDGFLTELYAIEKTKYDIDDFEYIKFKISDDVKNGIKYSKKDSMNSISSFKDYVEKELQGDVKKLKVYPIKVSGSLIAVKLKNFNLFDEPSN